MSNSQNEPKQMPNYMKFIIGGLAGMSAVLFVQPLDLIKTRLQTQGTGADRIYKNAFHCFQTVIQKEGPLAIYNGLGAALLRQATYTTARFGVFAYLNDYYKDNYMKEPTVLLHLGMGLTAGAVGAFVGTPADVILIRMTADGRLPVEKRRNYTSVFNGLVRIVREEGLFTLWRGCMPTVGRAIVVNMAQLSTYSQVKMKLMDTFAMEESFQVNLYASFVSGLFTAIASMPVDLSKTYIQSMKYVDGKPEYSGTIDVLVKIVRRDGIFALWKGLGPYYGRIAPQTIITFLLLEEYIRLYNKYILGISK